LIYSDLVGIAYHIDKVISNCFRLIPRKILDCTGGDICGERGARAYNGGLGQSPQRSPGAEPLVMGSRGRSPLEADSILAFDVRRKRQICLFVCIRLGLGVF